MNSQRMTMDAGGAALSHNSGTWSSPLEIDPTATSGNEDVFSSVSCPTTTFCMAVDVNGHAFSYSDGTWSKSVDLSAVEMAVEDYLQNPDADRGKDLLAALEELDEQIAQGDAYMATLRFPFAGVHSSVIGATNSSSAGEEVPSSAFQAQVALVKAAKTAVTRLSDLRAAYETVDAWRARDSAVAQAVATIRGMANARRGLRCRVRPRLSTLTT